MKTELMKQDSKLNKDRQKISKKKFKMKSILYFYRLKEEIHLKMESYEKRGYTYIILITKPYYY